MAEPLTITDPDDLEALDALARARNTSRETVLHETLARLREAASAQEASSDRDWPGWAEVWGRLQEVGDALPPERRTSNHDWLYDENGLPA